MSDKKKASELFIEVKADTDKLTAKLRAISKHLGALADELERIDGQGSTSEEKACKIIDLLNELDDKELKQLAGYPESLLRYRGKQ